MGLTNCYAKVFVAFQLLRTHALHTIWLLLYFWHFFVCVMVMWVVDQWQEAV